MSEHPLAKKPLERVWPERAGMYGPRLLVLIRNQHAWKRRVKGISKTFVPESYCELHSGSSHSIFK